MAVGEVFLQPGCSLNLDVIASLISCDLVAVSVAVAVAAAVTVAISVAAAVSVAVSVTVADAVVTLFLGQRTDTKAFSTKH